MATSTCCELWRHIEDRKWDNARRLLSEDFEAFWPQSRERIVGADNFIELNRCYPGEHKIEVLNFTCGYDQWDKEFTVSTQVHIESKAPDGKINKIYSVSFFELNLDGYIKGATEYWADIYDPPEWRKHLVETY